MRTWQANVRMARLYREGLLPQDETVTARSCGGRVDEGVSGGEVDPAADRVGRRGFEGDRGCGAVPVGPGEATSDGRGGLFRLSFV